MTYQVTFEERPTYLHAKVAGPRTPENALRFLKEVHEASVRLGHTAVLLEMNMTGPPLGIASVFSVISERSPEGAKLRRIAYVEVSVDSADAARFATTVAVNRGVNVRLFADVDAAALWLSEPETR